MTRNFSHYASILELIEPEPARHAILFWRIDDDCHCRPVGKQKAAGCCTIEWQDIQIHGDVVYEWGNNRQLIEYPLPRKSTPNEGKIMYILKRQRNTLWKIALESWNSSQLSQEHP